MPQADAVIPGRPATSSGEGERIDRIDGDEEQPFGIRAHHFGHDAAQHLDIPGEQRRPALAFALRGARDDYC